MKKALIILALVFTLVASITSCAEISSTSSGITTRTIDVSGTGKVKINPDTAYVNIGVSSQSPKIVDALKKNTAAAERIIQKLLDMGIEQKDIQTRNFNLYQQQEYQLNEEEQANTTFVVDNTVSVVVRDLDSLGEVLSTMISEGANTIYGISFDVEDRETAYKEARKLAIEDAKSQAEAIADVVGVKLGEISSISIYRNGGITPQSDYAMEAAVGIGGVPISSGTLTVQVTANLSFKIN